MKGHTWLRQNNDGLISIGIDEFGLNALGALSILSFPETGKTIQRGDMLFEGAYGNRKVKFLSPVNGIVSSVNRDAIGKKISEVHIKPGEYNYYQMIFLRIMGKFSRVTML